MKQGKRGSVRWRIALVYFMLVFIAMSIVSVFLLGRIEDYQMSSLKDNITKTVSESNLLTSLGRYDSLCGHTDEIQSDLDGSWTDSFSQELSVVSNNLEIVASTNAKLRGKNAAEVFDTDAIVASLVGMTEVESETVSGDIPVKNFCFPITDETSFRETEVQGVVYIRSDLSSVKSFLQQSRTIFFQATLIALIITVVLGLLLAKSITSPITDVTNTVQKMSQGDFSTEVPVKSDDEIGQLAEMFNILREKLDATLTEINSEKNKLGTILQYMADGLIAIDLQGNIIHANPTARKLLGIAENEDITELGYYDVLGKLDDSLALEKVKAGCEQSGGQTSFGLGDSYFVVRYDRFKDETGKDIGIIVIMQDISERKKLEDMQTDFVANVSHELKTPLTNIKSYTETLLDGALDDKETALGFLQIVDKEADRMNHLVKDLLQLSRLDHKQEPMNLREANIVTLVNICMMKMELTVRQKNLEFNALYDIDSDIRVYLDKDRMEQVVMNILTNALKYTNEGSIDIDIKEDARQVYVSVADTGVGIPAASLPRIFERFYRVDKARSRAMGGTGLGLAITKEIVDEHGGHIEAESEEGKGTKITVVLPKANRRGIRNIE